MPRGSARRNSASDRRIYQGVCVCVCVVEQMLANDSACSLAVTELVGLDTGRRRGDGGLRLHHHQVYVSLCERDQSTSKSIYIMTIVCE